TTRVARFSHAQHLKMGNAAPLIAAAIDKKTYLQPAGDIRRHLNNANACQACHRGLEESDHVTSAAMPQMADCLVCHNQIDNPFSCETCHAKDGNLKPASHVAGFLNAHTSGKLQLDKASCVVCHGVNFRCLGCPRTEIWVRCAFSLCSVKCFRLIWSFLHFIAGPWNQPRCQPT